METSTIRNSRGAEAITAIRSTLAAAAIGLGALLPATAAPVAYEIDASHTWVSYEVLHFGTSTSRGRLAVKAGSVKLDKESRSSELDVTIDTTAPSTGVPALDKMMQGERFFRSNEFPTARFVAAEMRFDGDKPVEVRGELTLLGATHPVTLKGLRFNCYTNAMLKREVCGGDFETTIQRSRWGMNWGTNFAADEVRLLMQVEAVKQTN